MKFYKALGSRTIPWSFWNPFSLYAGSKRTGAKGISGNLSGEGLTLGGFVLVGPGSTGVVWEHLEEIGEDPINWAPHLEAAFAKLPPFSAKM